MGWLELIMLLYGFAGASNALSMLAKDYEVFPIAIWTGVGIRLMVVGDAPVFFSLVPIVISGLSILMMVRNNLNTKKIMSHTTQEGPKKSEV